MMDEKDQHVMPTGVAIAGPAQNGVPRGVLPNHAWPQQAMVLQPPPTQPLPKKPWVPKIWIIFAVIGLLLLAPSVMTFLINLEPGDHSDNGDGQYWLSGLLLIPCMLLACRQCSLRTASELPSGLCGCRQRADNMQSRRACMSFPRDHGHWLHSCEAEYVCHR